MTILSVLNYIKANPGCTVNDILAAHQLALEDSIDDAEYWNREYTGAALLDRLKTDGYVTYEVTPRDGWKYTATTKDWLTY